MSWWNPYVYVSEMGSINPALWPILRNLPTDIKENSILAAVATYKGRAHAFIHCEDKKTYYVGSCREFGDGKYTYSMYGK